MNQSPTPVSTMLSPLERVNVDVMSRGAYTPYHRNTLEEVITDLREEKSKAVILSASGYNLHNRAKIAEITRSFPRVPTFALLTKERFITPLSAHSLGQAGVKTMVDVRSGNGWETLRKMLLRESCDEVQNMALSMINNDLHSVNNDCRKFFETLFTYHPYVSSVRQIAQTLNILPGTLLSRFYKRRLPSPKEYVDVARLIRAMFLLENTGLSVSTVAVHLGFSSPQAFSRHTQSVMNMPPIELRKLYNGEAMLNHFRERLILPYVDSLRSFRPTSGRRVTYL